MTPALAAVLAYLVLQFAIGVWASRRIRSESDYLVAGRQLGYALATFSIFATWFGSETVIGSAGNAYRDGVSLAAAEPFGYGLCLVLMGLIFAVPLWRRRLTTLADLYRQRYSATVERVAALILIPGSILWAAAQIRAFGHVLSVAGAGLPIDLTMAMAAGFTILYTAFGGLLADAITDIVQGVMLAVGLVIVLIGVLVHLPEAGDTLNVIATARPIQLVPAGVSILDVLEEWAIPVCGSVVATELVSRVIATRTERVARRSPLVAGAMYVSVGLIPVVIGLAAVTIAPGLADAEQAVPAVARQLLPTALFAIFAGGLVSAILSTVDSTLLVSSGLLSHNLVVPLAGITREEVKVLIARAGVVTFGIIAWLLAVRADGVFALVEQASALGSAGVLVTVCFGLFTSLGGPRTALATLLAGVAVYLAASYSGAAHPFLLSLGAALATYLAGAASRLLVRRPG
jgi:Na+/proline symporter